MALPDTDCFPGLDQADQFAAIYEAIYDLAQDDSLLDPSCFKGEDRLSQLTDFYTALYVMAGDDTLTSPDCFPGLDFRDQLTAIYAASILIEPTPPPVAAFSGTPLEGFEDVEVQFTDESTGSPTEWLWNFGDGNTSIEQNPSHIYADAGDYTVTLTVTNAGGSDELAKPDYISVSAFDADAAAYFARVAVTDPISEEDKETVNALFVGLKDLGLYASLTEGWITRSAFNAGTGTTVYALKNAANNGTLLNGAAWSANGVRITVKNQAMGTSLVSTFNHPWTVVVVFKDEATDTEANRRILGASALAAPTKLYIPDSNKTTSHLGMYNGSLATNPGGTVDGTQFGMRTLLQGGVIGVNGTLVGWNNNGSTLGSIGSNNSSVGSHSIQIGTSSGEGTLNPDLTVPIVLLWDANELTQQNVMDIYSLVKSTVGSGLSLP